MLEPDSQVSGPLQYAFKNFRRAFWLITAASLSGCDVNTYQISGKLFEWLHVLTSHGPDEPGLSPAKKRQHALPLNNPSFVAGKQAAHVLDDDLIVGIVVCGQALAYPWWLVVNHHVINDTFVVERDPAAEDPWEWWQQYERDPGRDDRYDRYIPLLISLCEACSGAAAYVPIIDGNTDMPLVFTQCHGDGSWAGNYQAVGVYTMCDYRTHSRWHPFNGRAGSSPLQGNSLERLPVVIDYWQDWLREHPDTKVVLAAKEARNRTHARLSKLQMAGPGMHPTFFEWLQKNPDAEDTRYQRTELVLGVGDSASGKAMAISHDQLQALGGLWQTEVGGHPYLFLSSGHYRAAVFSRQLQGRALMFELTGRDSLILTDAEGNQWNALGRCIAGPRSGSQLDIPADAYMAEWPDWIMNHRGSEVYAASAP